MSLRGVPILVMCEDAVAGHELVSCISRASGDVVFAANGLEASRHLRQFQFAAAVLALQEGAEAVAKTLQLRGVPFFIFGPAGAVTVAHALLVVDLALVVPTLTTLLS